MKYDDAQDPDFFDDMNFGEELVGDDKSKEGHKGGKVEKPEDSKDNIIETKKKKKMSNDPQEPLDEDLDTEIDLYGEE